MRKHIPYFAIRFGSKEVVRKYAQHPDYNVRFFVAQLISDIPTLVEMWGEDFNIDCKIYNRLRELGCSDRKVHELLGNMKQLFREVSYSVCSA